MDGYRPTLLGRALADALRDLEAAGELGAHESDALFALFDDVMAREVAAAPTHGAMEVEGAARAFNRFMDRWTVHATVPTARGVRLDGVPLPLETPGDAVEMLVKLHGAASKARKKRK